MADRCHWLYAGWCIISTNLQFVCKYTGVVVWHKSPCPRWTLGFVFISLPNTVSGKCHGLTDVFNMTDAFNFQAGGGEREAGGRGGVQPPPSYIGLCQHFCINTAHRAICKFQPEPLCFVWLRLCKLLFRHNEDVLDTSEGELWREQGGRQKEKRDGGGGNEGWGWGAWRRIKSEDSNKCCVCILNFWIQLWIALTQVILLSQTGLHWYMQGFCDLNL